jgi:hypothetical protein
MRQILRISETIQFRIRWCAEGIWLNNIAYKLEKGRSYSVEMKDNNIEIIEIVTDKK